MNDKTNNPQEKIETTTDSEELRDEELENVHGGAAYIKFDGVDGEAKDQNHDNWIDVLSVDWGTHKPRA